MKGKYAKRAGQIRDWNALERRALDAEHERDRLARELRTVGEQRLMEVASLRTELTATRKQRDENSSPLLVAAQERINVLAAESHAAKTSLRDFQKETEKLLQVMVEWVKEATGCTSTEAGESITYILYGERVTIVGGHDGVPIDLSELPEECDPALTERVRAIQRSRSVGTRRIRSPEGHRS